MPFAHRNVFFSLCRMALRERPYVIVLRSAKPQHTDRFKALEGVSERLKLLFQECLPGCSFRAIPRCCQRLGRSRNCGPRLMHQW